MSMKSVEVEISSISPLLMHAYPLVEVIALEKKSMEEQAELAAYRNPDNKKLYIPAECFQRALVSAATFSKGKGRGKSTLQKPVAACVMVEPERLDLGVKEYKIDSRPVVIKAIQGRIIRHRPRLDSWKVKMRVSWDDTLLEERELRKVFDDCGERVVVLDFRPERKGPFGRFAVSLWKS